MAEEWTNEEVETTPARPSSRQLLWGGAAVLLVLVVGSLAVFWLDPFGWHIVERLTGRYDAAIQAIPANSPAYAGVNLLEVNQDKLAALQQTFARAAPDLDEEAARSRLDDTLMTELGLSVDEDVLPWIGQYVGFGVISVDLEAESVEEAVQWVVSVESRNREASDAFMQKLADGYAANSGETAVAAVYNDVAITVFPTLAFARSEGLALIGSSQTAVEQAIDAQHGDSMADSELFAEAVQELPADRLLTFFMDAQQVNEIAMSVFKDVFSSFADLAETPESELPNLDEMQRNYVRGTAVAITLVDEGVQIDSISLFDPEAMTDWERELFNLAQAEADTAVLFPKDTFFYAASSSGSTAVWNAYRKSIIAQSSREDFDESMRLFEQEFGFNPETDFFPLLDGGLAIGMMPAADSPFAGLGGVMAMGTSDEAQMLAALTDINAQLGDPQTGMGTITPLAVNGLTLFEMDSILLPDIQPVYGVGSGNLWLGTGATAVQNLPQSEAESLASNGRFQTAWQAFPDTLSPVFFMDVTGLLDWAEKQIGA
ncbi:MAG: DUF3352 domain-containing protein, partial [Anaerolineae bacterium]